MIMNVAGCGAMKTDEAVVKELLENKYHKEFEVDSVQSHDFFRGYYTAIAYPADDPELLFTVQTDYSGESESDEYVSKLISAQIADKIAHNLDALPGFYYIHAAQFVSDTSLDDPDITAEAYLASAEEPDFNVYLCYCPDTEDLKVDANVFYDAVSHMYAGLEQMNGMIYLYVCDEKTLQNMQIYFETHDKLYYDFNEWADQFFRGELRVHSGFVETDRDSMAAMLRGE